MTNFQVYRKTLSYSFLMFVVDLFGLAVLGGSAVAGFFIANKSTDKAIIGLIVGFVIGCFLAAFISIFITNRIKAAQIAMMTKGVTEDSLPEHTFSEGFKEVKGRFGKITLFFFITNAIKGIFRQLGRGVTRFGQVVGGDVGGGIASAVDSAIQTLVAYLCDCCLGWMLFRKDENSFKAACEGAVIFFKHGKTLLRNVGRIFGIGIASFIVIGGIFFGVNYLIFMQFPGWFNTLVQEIIEANQRAGGDPLPEFITNPATFMIAAAGFLGIMMWSILHSVLIRPFILTGVLRNYMAAGIKEMPTEADFKELDAKSPRFAKLHSKFDTK